MDSRLRYVLIAVALAAGVYFLFIRKSNDHAPPAVVEIAVPAPALRPLPERTVWLRSGPLHALVSTYSGAIQRMYLNNDQFRGQEISTTSQEYAQSLRSVVVFERDGANVMPAYLTFAITEEAPDHVVMVSRERDAAGHDLGVEVVRTIRAGAEYAFDVRTRVINHGAPGRLRYAQGVYHWVRRDQESGGFFRQSWRLTEGMCGHHNGALFRESRDDIGKRNGAQNSDNIASNAQWVGIGNLYFLSALLPVGETAACHLQVDDRSPRPDAEPSGSLVYARLSWAPTPLPTGETHEYATIAYFGPKLTSALVAVNSHLRESQNLGFFAVIARVLLWLLQRLHRLPPHNWGVAIILLTVIVRILLFPILARSTKSLAMMQRLKPEIDALNIKYKDNQEQKGLATMELYRKHKVNPLGGCLPQLAQLPVWWALYTTLQTSVELFHSPFVGWVHDLSAPDPFRIGPVPLPILPLVLGAVMFLQQKIMPPAMPDPVQAKIMMYFMPIFLTGISLFLPSGLALYMLVNSCLAIVQQKITKAQIDRMNRTSEDAIAVRPAPVEIKDELPPREGSRGGNGGGKGRGGKRR